MVGFGGDKSSVLCHLAGFTHDGDGNPLVAGVDRFFHHALHGRNDLKRRISTGTCYAKY